MEFIGISFITGVSLGLELTTKSEIMEDDELHELAETLWLGVFTIDLLILRLNIGI